MTTFRKVEPLLGSRLKAEVESHQHLKRQRYQSICLEQGDDIFTLNYDEAIALCDWLASATGHYPKEPKP